MLLRWGNGKVMEGLECPLAVSAVPPPRIVLLAWVDLLAGVPCAIVLQRLANAGMITLPKWWPIGNVRGAYYLSLSM